MNRTSPSQFTIPLLAVEMQYFRLPRNYWEFFLGRACQMGANTISTCVPWSWHEYQEDQFDFTGDHTSTRNLIGFIRLASDMGLRVILRPGPFVDSDLLGGGIPAWLLARSPQMLATRMDGTTFRHPASDTPRASYLHPQFLENVRIWYNKFSEMVLPHQWPRGPVIALQVDHETPGHGMLALDIDDPSFDPHFRGDYNPHIFNELFPQWLEKRFHNIETLNSAYESSYGNFENVPYPSRWRKPKSIGDIRYWQDITRFYDWTFNQALTTYSSMLRQAGWNIPLFHNLIDLPWQVSGLQIDMAGYASAVGWLGSSLIPHKPKPFQAKNSKENVLTAKDRITQMAPEDYINAISWRTSLLKNYSPHLPSFSTHISSQNDFLLQAPFACTLEAGGIYPGVESFPEPFDIGSQYRWAPDAPIRKDGSLRRNFWNVRSLYTYLNAGGEHLARSYCPADIAVGYSHVPELVEAWNFSGEEPIEQTNWPSEIPEAYRGCNMAHDSQLLASRLTRAGFPHTIIDIDTSPGQLDRFLLLVMPATPILARSTQERMVKYLASGKNIFWVGAEIPILDENLQTCDLINRYVQDCPNFHLIPARNSDWIPLLRSNQYRHTWIWANNTQSNLDLKLNLRYGTNGTCFMGIINYQSQMVSSEVVYLDSKQFEKSIKVRVGGPHASFIRLHDEHLEGALIHCGENSPISGPPGENYQSASIETGQESILLEHGQAVCVYFGRSLLISASETTSLTLTRPGGWEGLRGWRLLMDGGVEPAAFFTKGNRLYLPYPIEVSGQESEAILLLPANSAIDSRLWSLLTSRLVKATLCIERVCEVSQTATIAAATSKVSTIRSSSTHLSMAINQLRAISDHLRALSRMPQSMESFVQKWQATTLKMFEPWEAFGDALCKVRNEIALHPRDAELSELENTLATSLTILENTYLI